MAESDKKQPGDGRDNPGNAAKQAANAAKEIGKNAGKQAAAKGTEAVANAAASSVKAGVAAGKAVSGIWESPICIWSPAFISSGCARRGKNSWGLVTIRIHKDFSMSWTMV